ncbi:MAG: TIM-barrel domain-containing protein [Candidatus Eisenbacteria bacterium]
MPRAEEQKRARGIAAVLAASIALAALALPSGARASAEPEAELIGERIVRFYESEEARANASPSIALDRPRPALGPAPPGFPVRPIFQNLQNRNGVRVKIEEGTSLYGTGEVPGPLLRNGRKTTLWNFDAFGWGDDTAHLYQSHPWVLAVRADGTAFGLLFDTTHRSHIDLAADILFITDGPPFAVIVIDRDSPEEVVRALADLTGHMPLPPLWALGYHQCRYSYYPDERVREVAHAFREKRIPCDVIWLDIDYMDGFRSFTFHPARFPDPLGLNEDLRERGFHTVWMLDPGIKKESGYFVYDTGTASDVWVKSANGKPYVGRVWPGDCVFPDFTAAPVRAWWADLVGSFLETGIDGVWNDMNEPAVFDVWDKTMPLSNVHRADEALGGPDTHARYHNVYGMQMVRATREGMLLARPDKRPFVLSRANHLGGHRYAAAWSGDNIANWYHLDVSIPNVLNLGLSGQPLSGPDIGGFAEPCDGPFFARWMGIGALLPFARGHTAKGNIDKEPWAFGPEAEATCRRALERRSRLMPYIYTVVREASVTGLPIARPLFFADPADPSLRSEDDAFLLGGDLIVSARTTPEGDREPVLPIGDWKKISLEEGTDAGDPDLPELFIRSGAIVPLGPVMQFAGEKPLDSLTLLVRLDEGGRAEGYLYEDDGESNDYENGAFRLTKFVAAEARGVASLTSNIVEGSWREPRRTVSVRILLEEETVEAEWKKDRGISIRVGR